VKKIIDEHGARIDIRNRTKSGEEGVAGAQISILFLQLADDADAPDASDGTRVPRGVAAGKDAAQTKAIAATAQTRVA
jgi:hypothetical protein